MVGKKRSKKGISKNNSSDHGSSSDRLSNLPQEILERIVSFLPLQEAIATTTLSKQWRNVWTSSGCLNLGKPLYDYRLRMVKKDNKNKRTGIEEEEKQQEQGEHRHIIAKKNYQRLRDQFIDFVDRSLDKHHPIDQSLDKLSNGMGGAAQSVHLYMPNCIYSRRLCAKLDRWVERVVDEFGVHEFSLNVEFMGSAEYQLPRQVFGKSVGKEVLNLKRLFLHKKVQINPEIMEGLATKCLFLESLSLDGCRVVGFSESTNVKECRFSKLDRLVLHHGRFVSKLMINAPNLVSLDFKIGWSFGRLGLDDVVQFEDIRRICLRNVRLTRAICSRSPQDVALLSKVEELVLESCNFSPDFFIPSKCLKSLCLLNCDSLQRVIKAPNLKCLTSDSCNAPSFGLPYPEIEKFSVHLLCRGTMAELIESLTKFNFDHCQMLEIDASMAYKEKFIIAPHLRETSGGLLHNVKHLSLKLGYTYYYYKSFRVHEFVESLLWLTSNPQTIQVSMHKQYSEMGELKVFKFKYFKEGENGANRCERCSSLPVLCWEHHLQEVSIENYKGEDANVKSYERTSKARARDDDKIKAFFENVREVTKIVVKIIERSVYPEKGKNRETD